MKQHLLVVDDEESIRELLSSYFKKHGYNVTTAATPAEAIEIANQRQIHLIVLDLALADADGLELLELLKKNHPNLPIVILTGMGFDEELFQEAREKGASAYISKNLPIDQLLMEVVRNLKYQGKQPQS
ncbi:MAG: response regulator [Verrucomicrobia bacterium]|nr:response regulator [Verrucomicrobiota bacterium]